MNEYELPVRELREALQSLIGKLDDFELMATASFIKELTQIRDGGKPRVIAPCISPSGEPKLLIYLSLDPEEIIKAWRDSVAQGGTVDRVV
jgi:hypothetical protein